VAALLRGLDDHVGGEGPARSALWVCSLAPSAVTEIDSEIAPISSVIGRTTARSDEERTTSFSSCFFERAQ